MVILVLTRVRAFSRAAVFSFSYFSAFELSAEALVSADELFSATAYFSAYAFIYTPPVEKVITAAIAAEMKDIVFLFILVLLPFVYIWSEKII